MHNRLKQFLAAENITQALFAETIGIGKANVSHVLSGRNKPGYDFITAIMRGYPQLNINWLMLGTEKMYNSSDAVKSAEKERETSLLFPAEEFTTDDFSTENVSDAELQTEEFSDNKSIPEAPFTETENKSSENSFKLLQTAVKQRNVSKIIILFDDGSYQEM